MKKVEIPEKITNAVYITIGTGKYNFGETALWGNKMDDDCEDFGRITIFKKDIELDLSELDLNEAKIKGLMISFLREKIKKRNAEFHMEMKSIEEKIQNLLSIEHIENTIDDDMPF